MDALLKEVKTLGESLSLHLPDFKLGPHFQRVQLVDGNKKKLLDIESQIVKINRKHPLAKVLSDGKPGRAEALVSAIICLINREEKDLTDEHQRDLHRVLLESMVEPPSES